MRRGRHLPMDQQVHCASEQVAGHHLQSHPQVPWVLCGVRVEEEEVEPNHLHHHMQELELHD